MNRIQLIIRNKSQNKSTETVIRIYNFKIMDRKNNLMKMITS